MKVHPKNYDEVAKDYYDSSIHPTCANFREASKIALKDFLTNIKTIDLISSERVLETGAGKSLLSELLEENDAPMQNLTIQDMSPLMLSHSRKWENQLCDFFISDAREMPIPDSSYQSVFSFLADPYDEPNLYREIFRVLEMDGIWFLTTPSYKWGKEFRSATDQKISIFENRDKSLVELPSYLYETKEHIENVCECSFSLEYYRHIYSKSLKGHISKKLNSELNDAPVLEVFAFKKK